MSEKNKKPEIRFKGFTDDWEEKKYSETFKKIPNNTLSRDELNYSAGLSKNVHYGDVLIKFGELLDVEKNEIPYITNDILANKFKPSKLQSGDVIIADAAEDETVGKCTELVNVGEEIIFSGLHTIPSRPTISFASGYLGYFMNSPAYHTQLLRLMQGTKVLSISKTVLQDTDINYPIDNPEQSKIGTYFKNLDHLITLHQRKYDKLVTIKKAMLEKMFPKNGLDVPEIRFKGFTEAWEEKELGEMATIKTGFPIDSNKFNDNGEYLVITNGNIQNDSHTVDNSNGNRIDIENNASLSEYVLNPNDILVTMDGTVGRTAKVVEQKQILAQRVGRLTAKLETEFLYQFLNTGKFFKEMSLISHGGTIKHISLSEISIFISYMPSYREEQKKIGTFFKHLDTLITLQKRELVKLKNIKKACLEKMFV
jgi:type I restriction enzyme S subunit